MTITMEALGKVFAIDRELYDRCLALSFVGTQLRIFGDHVPDKLQNAFDELEPFFTIRALDLPWEILF